MIWASLSSMRQRRAFRALGQVGQQVLAQALGGRRERRQFAVARQLQVPALGRGRGNRKAHVAEQRAASGARNASASASDRSRLPQAISRAPLMSGRTKTGSARSHAFGAASPASDSPRDRRHRPAARQQIEMAQQLRPFAGGRISRPVGAPKRRRDRAAKSPGRRNRRRSGNSRISWLAGLGKAQPT